MPTLDTLPADRRAIIELLLRRSRSYAEISKMLDLPEARVRSHARESLLELAPRSAARVDPAWRERIADYLLNQQEGSEAEATRSYIAGSETARAWALSVSDSLGDLYAVGTEPRLPGDDDVEPIVVSRPEPATGPPEGAAAPRLRASGAAVPTSGRQPLSPDAERIVLRRRIAGALAATLVIAVTGALVGRGCERPPERPATSTEAAGAEVTPTGILELEPERGEEGAGIATFLTQEGRPGLLVQAELEPSSEKEAYEVWLYNDQEDAQSVGAQVTDEQGAFVGTGPLPTDFGSYRFIDVSREPVDEDTAHSGDSVLRGRIADIEPIPPGALEGAAPQDGAAPPLPPGPTPPAPQTPTAP